MKKILILIIVVGFIFFLLNSDTFAALNPYRSRCVGIQGTFTANSTWTGGSIQVGCGGDDGLAVTDPAQRCTGEILTVRPGQTYRLTKCSCFGSDKGCLKMGKTLRLEPLVDRKRKITVVTSLNQVAAFTQNSCRVTDISNVCGANGQHITGNIRITCQVPTPTPNPTVTPTPPVVTPNPSTCPAPGVVTNVKIECPNCGSDTSTTTTTQSGG